MPMNRPWSVRPAHIAIVSAFTLFMPLASSMFAPGVPSLLAEFRSSSTTLSSFVVSVYILGLTMGPLVIAPLCEHFGRLPFYHLTNLLFVAFTAACALSTNLGMLIGIKVLAGCAGAALFVLGAGSIADLFRVQVRGKVMAVYTFGALLGPVSGPVAGDFEADAVGWRWVFWTLAIAVRDTRLRTGLLTMYP
jgi:multidrug resistance protein